MTVSVPQASAEASERGWPTELWRHFLDDVIRRPTIGPVAAWLILGLVTLVGWLTAQYAPGAVTGAACGTPAQQAANGSSVIPVNAGYGTVLAVMAITLMAGMQPVLEKRFNVDWQGQLSDWFTRQSRVVRAPVIFVSRLLGGLFQIPAWMLSFADYLLARPIALIAGAGLSPFWLRYGVFLAWMAAAIAAAWLLPQPLGLWSFFLGAALVIGVVRRWSWVEADREAFFVARRQRKQNERIGFAEDLRDEALVALVFLFVLIPLGLRQVELMRPETFCINGTSDADAGVLTWLGFFGAELAKSVPFVDWSEVFHVANGSPIEPNTALGAQVVFAMRATLDLLMIAAVVQAVQLASRLAAQNTAFAAGDINILEPFVERSRFRALGAYIDRDGVLKVIEWPAVEAFPAYSPERLEQIVKGHTDRRAVQAAADAPARRAALVLVVKQAAGVGRSEEARPLIVLAKSDPVETNRRLARRLLRELEPESPLVVAYARAQQRIAQAKSERLGAHTKDIAIDAETLLHGFKDHERPLALRAIRNVQGEVDVMIPIPAGRFMMGAPGGEDGSTENERPQHQVRVAAFEIGKYPVTFEEFDAFCEATGYWRKAHGTDRPHDDIRRPRAAAGAWDRERSMVTGVSWYDAKAYIEWLNSWSDGGYRLPSEAEWEYACRAGTTTRWFFGDDKERLGEYAWIERASEGHNPPVGKKMPNLFGLHDVYSNSEWCEDPWHKNYDWAPSDGTVWTAGGDTSLRVVRGFSSARRFGSGPAMGGCYERFRVARTVFVS